MRKSQTHRHTEFMAHRQTHTVHGREIPLQRLYALSLSLSLSGTAGVRHNGAWGMTEITQLRYVQMAPLKHWVLCPTQGRDWESRGEKQKWQGKEGSTGWERVLVKKALTKSMTLPGFWLWCHVPLPINNF